ncbi:MAG: response regulator [Planctomycetes bacterium]|nr:response regulator [Planctomycetota bacterium]
MERAADKTILVVDDEPNVRQYLKTVLQDAGFKVVTAGDGVEALEIIKEKVPDFISLDLIMPKKSGHKLLHELRRNKLWSRIPVLIVTAHAQDELGKADLQDLLDSRVMSGPGTYLEKPVKPLTYVRSIQRALGIEEAEETADRINLKEELRNSLRSASPEALRKALEALKETEN